jgi:DNA-binding NarL/FixJ family response regulator
MDDERCPVEWLPDYLDMVCRGEDDERDQEAGPAEAIRVLLLDPSAMVGAALARFLEAEADITVVGDARSPEEVADAGLAGGVDVIVCQMDVLQADEFALIERLVDENTLAPILAIVTDRDAAAWPEGCELMVQGWIHRDVVRAKLANAIRTLHGGDYWLDREFVDRLRAARATDREQNAALRRRVKELESPLRTLTPREKEVLQGLVDGLSNAEIAARCHLSVSSVKGYVRRILRKLEVTERGEAVRVARELGFGGP